MQARSKILGRTIAVATIVAALSALPASASADDALKVSPAVHRVSDSNGGATVQLVRWGWGPGGYGYYRPYRPYGAYYRPYYGGYYGAYPAYGYAYPAPAYGYAYPAYGYPVYGGVGVRVGGIGVW